MAQSSNRKILRFASPKLDTLPGAEVRKSGGRTLARANQSEKKDSTAHASLLNAHAVELGGGQELAHHAAPVPMRVTGVSQETDRVQNHSTHPRFDQLLIHNLLLIDTGTPEKSYTLFLSA